MTTLASQLRIDRKPPSRVCVVLECATVNRPPPRYPTSTASPARWHGRHKHARCALLSRVCAPPPPPLSTPPKTRSRAEVTMLRSLTPHVTLWRCAQIRLLQPAWPVLFAVIRAAGAGAVHAHDSYRPPSSPPLALDSVHAHGVVPHLLLAVRRSAVGWPSRLHELIRTPRAYICRIAGPRLHFSAARTMYTRLTG